MSPRRNTRPTLPTLSPDTPHSSRDTSPETVPRSPTRGEGGDPAPVTPPGRQPDAAEPQSPTILLAEITSQTPVHESTTAVPLDHYHLSPELVPMLSEPDATTGIRTFRTRTYVDLTEGGTVLLGRDAEQNYRARLSTELIASGPRLEQVEGSLLWRLAHRAEPVAADSTLTITRRRLAEDEPSEVIEPKRQHTSPAQSEATLESAPAFVKNWGIEPRFTVPDFLTIDGVHYKVVTRADAREYPITYIQQPSHSPYDFDVLEATLRHTPDEQPRSAIRVPPDNHWQIDARLPFDKPLTAYVREAFPEVTTVTLENIARKQFTLANSSSFADAAGLTALRQIFSSWKDGTPSPHPEWSDPLLMLPVLRAASGSVSSTARSLDLPPSSSRMSLDRLDFDPQRFTQQWDYFVMTYSPLDLKRFMANLMTRNGYAVFEPNSFNSFPALVFRRTGHDYVFFMSLHRTRIPKISLPAHTNPNTTGISLETQVGEHAANAVREAHQNNKLIWLKGGSQIRPNYPDTVFIVRDDDARL